jgi:hypothetical protein
MGLQHNLQLRLLQQLLNLQSSLLRQPYNLYSPEQLLPSTDIPRSIKSSRSYAKNWQRSQKSLAHPSKASWVLLDEKFV